MKTVTNKVKLNLLLFISLIFVGFSNAHNIVYSSLILQPKIKLESTSSRLSRLALSGISGLATGYGSFKLIEAIKNHNADNGYNIDMTMPIAKVALVPGSIATILCWFLAKDHYHDSYKRAAAEQFIKYWPEYKNNSPIELHKLCEHYYGIYKRNPYEFKDQAITFVNLIEQYHKKDDGNFFSRLKSFFDRKFFSSSLHADLGSTLNGVSNIINSCKTSRR